MNEQMIRFNNVTYKYGHKKPFGEDKRKTVLDGIDFELKAGEIVCLLGPSGGGKTTMVNLMMGSLIPEEGSVSVMGEVAPYKNVREKIGYMPQDDALYDDITAKNNLEFFGSMNGMSRSEIKKRVQEVLTFGRLEDDREKLVSAFSGGMKRRLSLGVALMHNPELLILDEPTVGLDPDHRRRIWDSFDEMSKNGKSILVTTHVMEEAERCDIIAMLHDGHIIATGSPKEILSRTGTSNLEEAFLALEVDQHA